MRKLLMMATVAAIMPVAAQATCATQTEASAMNLRALKSSLMVAALSCNQQASYNAFINKHKGAFNADSAAVKGYFRRAYGGGADHQLNKFVTRLANDASQRSMGAADTYCAEMKEAFSRVVSMDRGSVKGYAAGKQFASLHGIRTCATGSSAAKLAMNK